MAPSSPLARAAARQEQQAETDKRIAAGIAEAHAKPQLVKPFKANQQNFAPDNVLTQRWRLVLPLGVDYESLFESEAFSLFHSLTPGMVVEVIDEGQTFFAELLCIQRNGPWTKMHELTRHDLPSVGVSNSDRGSAGYEVFAVGPKWRVRRKPFRKPSGQMQPEHTYPNVFDSKMDAKLFVQQSLIGTR